MLCIFHVSAGEWTGERELKIDLGYQAYIIPDKSVIAANAATPCQELLSCITLLDGGVRTEAFAIVSSSGSTAVMAPENPPPVTAMLVAPQVRVLGARQVLSAPDLLGQ